MANRNEVRFVVGAASDVGKVREVNEDAHGFARSAAGDLILVCDGMGGHAGGQVASQMARDAIVSQVTSAGRTEAASALRAAIQEGHRKVRELAGANAELHGMGTTCVAALVRGNRATVANVGDSRCYLVAGGAARQVSKDHTKAQQLLDQGLIAPEQFANHPQKGVLAMALGQTQLPEPAIAEVELGVGDYLVLCSDGAYDCLSLAELAELTAGLNPNLAADRMVEVAVERDGKDNSTVVIGRSVDFTVRAVATAPVQVEPAVVAKPKWRRLARTWGPSVGGALIGALATVGVYSVACHGPAEKAAVVPATVAVPATGVPGPAVPPASDLTTVVAPEPAQHARPVTPPKAAEKLPGKAIDRATGRPNPARAKVEEPKLEGEAPASGKPAESKPSEPKPAALKIPSGDSAPQEDKADELKKAK